MQAFLTFLKMIITKLISIPGARRIISPVFYYFGIFDDLQLYQYHDREYGEVMTSLFETINSVEDQKWKIINYELILGWMNIK